MGLFDFISPPPPLDSRFKDPLALELQNKPDILGKLARIQDKLSREIPPGENILLISYGEQMWMEGFGIVTDKRVMLFNKKVEKQLPLFEIAEVESLVHPSGNFLVAIWGHKALPFKGFASDRLSEKAVLIIADNRVIVSMEDQYQQAQFLVSLKAARGME